MIKNITLFLFVFVALLATLNSHTAQSVTWKNVDYIVDGDTFVTDDGSHVRLLGINTPEVSRNGRSGEVFGDSARLKLTKLIFNQRVKLTLGARHKDRYGRLLAHVYKENGEWVNATLIDEGLAHVYSFPDNRQLTRELIKRENIARANNKGLWAHPRWKIHTNVNSINDKDIGQFNLFEGTVHHITTVKKKTYLNFSANWRKDFTVEIPERFYTLFEKSGIDIKEHYKGKKLQVRGVFKPVNGVLIIASHPEQLTILD